MGRWAAYQKPHEPKPDKLAWEEQIRRRIDYWHTLLPCAGVRKLRELIQGTDGILAGKKLIRRLMNEMGLHAIYPKPNLSKPGKEHRKFPYLLKNLAISFPNQVWSIDITYIPMGRGHMYMTAIIDWYSRFVVGWALSDTLDTAPIIEALTQAFERHGVPAIINSDQGSNFTSDAYINLLKSYGIRQSMDGKARWVDNVIIERWFRSLKTEYVYINEYASPRELRNGIKQYIQDYNNIRPHQSWDYETPATVYHSSFSTQGIA
jgi:putative transposase